MVIPAKIQDVTKNTMTEIESHLSEIDPIASNLIEGLQKVQQGEGYISDEAITACAEYFGMPEVEVEGVVSFYAQFKRIKPGFFSISICDGTACHIKGASLLIDWISAETGISEGETDKDGLFSLETVACLGCCSLAPVMSVNGEVFGNLNRKKTLRILKKFRREGMC